MSSHSGEAGLHYSSLFHVYFLLTYFAFDQLCPLLLLLLLLLRMMMMKMMYLNGVQQLATSLTAMGTHMPYGNTQCYLPPGRGDIPALTPADAGNRLSDPGGMQG